MTWFITVITLAGVFLNARGKWQGFCCWLVSNTYWCWHNIQVGEYAQASLFGVFWMMSLYGIWRWLKQTSIAQIGSIGWMKNRLRAADIAIEIIGSNIGRLQKERKQVVFFCQRIVKLKSLPSGDKRKINWLFGEAERIYDLVKGGK